MAFEAAWQLERAGERVAALMLICPGNPELRQADAERYGRESSYRNPAYLTILHSVFAGSVGGPGLAECLAEVRDEDGFAAFVHRTLPELDEELIRRVARIVGETYEFEYTFRELAERRLSAPVTVFKATGDDYSFIEGSSGWSAAAPATVRLAGDHYGVLREQGVDELAAAIAAATGGGGGVGGNTPDPGAEAPGDRRERSPGASAPSPEPHGRTSGEPRAIRPLTPTTARGPRPAPARPRPRRRERRPGADGRR